MAYEQSIRDGGRAADGAHAGSGSALPELQYGTFYSQMKTFAKGSLVTPGWVFI